MPTDLNSDADAGRKSTFNPVYMEMPSSGLSRRKQEATHENYSVQLSLNMLSQQLNRGHLISLIIPSYCSFPNLI